MQGEEERSNLLQSLTHPQVKPPSGLEAAAVCDACFFHLCWFSPASKDISTALLRAWDPRRWALGTLQTTRLALPA